MIVCDKAEGSAGRPVEPELSERMILSSILSFPRLP